jgi:hypothetical protein
VTALLAGNWWASREAHELMERGASLDEMAPSLRRMAETIRVSNIESFLEETIGDDHIAFYHPKKRGWRIMAHLISGPAEAKRWAASQIASAEIQQGREEEALNAKAIRDAIDQRVTEIFGDDGSQSYRQTVEQIRTMALKVATAPRVDGAPVIDGSPDEPIWDRADPLKDFIVYGQASEAEYPTRVRLLHDGANLYVALNCEQDTSSLVTEAAPRDGATWDDDSVEIFINPTSEQLPYVQFIISAGGAFFDLWARTREETYGDRRGHNFDTEWATQIQDDRWTAELRLPLDECGCAPSDHEMLLVDFVRNVQGEAGEISAWFPSTGSHADPKARGWLLLK